MLAAKMLRRSVTTFVALTALTAAGALAAPGLALAKPYQGAELYSSASYKYGRMEMRMRMARGSGILSTFFTYKLESELTDTFWEEIDIEVFGKDNATTWQSNIITGLGTRATSEEIHTHPVSLADDYHTYALEWTPDHVAWEVDGVVVRTTTTSQVSDLSNPQSLRFNLWAANIAEWVGDFDTSALPQYQYVNWISYSRYENGNFIHEWTDDFDTLNTNRWGRADWTFDENLADFNPENVIIQDGTLILALTQDGQTGFTGTVPKDTGSGSEGTGGASGEPGTGGASGVGGSASGGGGVAGVGGSTSTGGDSGLTGSGGLSGSGGGLQSTGGVSGGQVPSLTGGASDGATSTMNEQGGCSYSRSAPGKNPSQWAIVGSLLAAWAWARRRKSLRATS